MVAEVLEKAEDDAHTMICDQNAGDNYQGLDMNRDTVKEVETILRIFPNLLSKRKEKKRKETKWDNEEGEWIAAEDGKGYYQIQCVQFTIGTDACRCNLKATSFVAVLARVTIELDQFGEEERGGLLIEGENGWNTLQNLALMNDYSVEEEHNQRVGIVCLSQFIQLRQMYLFIQEDIPRYELVHNLCDQDYFAENTFKFLVEMHPSSLVHTDEVGFLPLHHASNSTTQAFRIVFECLNRYYPTKKGISSLFIKNNYIETPFQLACQKYERNVVMTVIEDTLNNADIPINTGEALVTAAANVHVHVECVYLLLKREPDVLVRLLSEPHSNNNDDGGGGGRYNNGNDVVDDDIRHTVWLLCHYE